MNTEEKVEEDDSILALKIINTVRNLSRIVCQYPFRARRFSSDLSIVKDRVKHVLKSTMGSISSRK